MDVTVTLSDKNVKDLLNALDCLIDQNFKIAIETYMKAATAEGILDTKMWRRLYYEARAEAYRLRCLRANLQNL